MRESSRLTACGRKSGQWSRRNLGWSVAKMSKSNLLVSRFPATQHQVENIVFRRNLYEKHLSIGILLPSFSLYSNHLIEKIAHILKL